MISVVIKYEKSDAYEFLADEHEIFERYYDVLLFFALVGYENDKFVRGAPKTDDPDTISNDTATNEDIDEIILASLGFQHTGQPTTLANEEKQFEIVAAYAAGGEKLLNQKIESFETDPTDEIISYVRSTRKGERKTDQGILGEIKKSFDDEIIGV